MRFDDREQANDWIRRRHTGVAGGEGRITWKPLEIRRFSGDYTTIDVINFVGRNAGYSKEEWEHAQSALGGGKSTNLTRLLESAAGQSHLGIKVETEPSRKTPLLAADPKWALEVLRRIVDDILKGDVDSRRLNRATDIEKYFANLPAELQPGPSTTVTAPEAFRDIGLPGSRVKPPQKLPLKTRPAPRTRKTLAPKKHPFDTTKSTKLGMLLKEAGTLDVGKFPLSSAFVLRAVAELAVNDYLKTNALPLGPQGGPQFDLTKKASDVVEDLKSSGKVPPSDLRAFRNNLLTKTSACSIQSLNGFVHTGASTHGIIAAPEPKAPGPAPNRPPPGRRSPASHRPARSPSVPSRERHPRQRPPGAAASRPARQPPAPSHRPRQPARETDAAR